MNKTVSIDSDTKNISIVEQLIDEINRSFHLDHDIYGNMLISVLEAVTNSVVHGNKKDPSKKVSLTFSALADSFVFEIQDQGTGFDYTLVPDPTKPLNVEKPHGRGIFLMMNLSDEITFEDKGRRVILTFFRRK